jgi:hypothetical protein
MNNLIKLIILSLVFLSGKTYSGTIDPNTPDEKYIEYGKEFECVLEIMGSYDKTNNFFYGSAVAIDPHWILTAAHVVKDAKIVFIYDDTKKKATGIDLVIPHHDFEESKFGIADIALCYTSSDIGLDSYPSLYEDTDELEKLCSIAGYGQTGNFNTGIYISDNHKRAGTNRIDFIENDLLICSPSRNDKTKLEFLIGNGDSGGGLFIDGKLAGINSCVTAVDKKPNSTYNDDGGHTRVSKFFGWIKEQMQKKEGKH